MTTVTEDPALTPAAERILATASRLFYENGIHAVGVDRIAEESGVTKRTLYDRFGSKEELVLAYLRRREQLWRAMLAQHLQKHPEPGRDRVLAVFDAGAQMHDRTSKGCSAVNARAEEAPDAVGHAIAEEVVAQKAWMRKRFEALCREAGYADPSALGAQLQILFDGALVTFGTRAVKRPLGVARETASVLLDHAATRGRRP
ncbi:MAG TPA: helix-turn-helix domain-containing protein [Candidatus Nanopelagicales bacterium]|nr:helix-turn-helix domain-containing protein [Candidatus Nanopelagicales bacterium]